MRRAIYTIIAILAMASCTQNEEVASEHDHEMVFVPSVSATTRGTIINPDDFAVEGRTFHIYATASDTDGSSYPVAKADVEYSGSGWSPADGSKVYWPTSESDVTFYAWYPATVAPAYTVYNEMAIACDTYALSTPSDNGAITLTAETVGNQDDIMACITTQKNPTMQSVAGEEPIYTVDLDFMHLYTNLRFQYKTQSGVSVRVKAMTLHNLDSKCGFYYYYNSGTFAWASYGNYFTNTIPNYHGVPMEWGSAEYVTSTDTAVEIDGDNDLLIFPQTVSAWDPTGIYKTVAQNDSYTNNYDKRAYLRIYCDIMCDGTLVWGDDLTVDSDATSITMDPDHCIYVPISSKDSAGDELWSAGQSVTYTLTFGSGYDQDGELISLDTSDVPIPITVTASLSGWNKWDGELNLEF